MTSPSAPPDTPPPVEERYLPLAEWRYWHIIAVFFSGLVVSVFVAAAFVGSGVDPLSPLPFSAIFGSQAVSSFLMVRYLSKRGGSGSLATDVGFVVESSDWWGIFAGMGLQLVIAVVTAPIILWFWPDGPPIQSVAEVAQTSETLVEQLAIIAVVAVGAPIIEEIIFRGMLLSVLARTLAKWPSILASAAIFSAIHLFDPNAVAVVPGLFLLGVVLAWVALKRGNLSLAIALHSGINLLAAIGLLYGESLLKWAEDQMETVGVLVRMM